MFQGLRTAIYGVSDIAAAKAWYSEVLGFAPYFDQPYYVGFNVGGYELGLDPNAAPGNGSASGVIIYWGVPNADGAMARLRDMGAKEVSAMADVGDNIKVALVSDPYGNVFGIIENPNFTLPA